MSPCDTTSVRSFAPRSEETASLVPVRAWQQSAVTGLLLIAGGGGISTLLTVTTGNGILAVAVGTVLCGPGLAVLFMSLANGKQTKAVETKPSWDLYPDRLVRRCGNDAESLPLADIVETYCDHSTEGEALLFYRLIAKDRREHRIDSCVENHTELGEEVLKRVNQRVLAEAKAILDGGGEVTFGPISLNDEHLRHRGRKFEWHEIKKLEFRVMPELGNHRQFAGTLHTDSFATSILQNMDQVPNAPAFEQLIRGTPLFAA